MKQIVKWRRRRAGEEGRGGGRGGRRSIHCQNKHSRKQKLTANRPSPAAAAAMSFLFADGSGEPYHFSHLEPCPRCLSHTIRGGRNRMHGCTAVLKTGLQGQT
eukprot:763574-Hanusia_phi.AAC.2